jgi:FkbM family methyltransferase
MLQGKGAGASWNIQAEIAAALPFISSGGIVFDVGANVGDWSAEISRRVEGVRHFLFEPQEACQPYLKDLVTKGAVWTKAAVGETDGRAMLYSPGGTAGNASLYERRDTFFLGTTFVPQLVMIVSLDGFMERHGINCVDFMKMDIEGHELAALKGASRALSSKAIRALSFEFGSGNINSRTFFHDYWDLLTSSGYRINRVLPAGRLLPIERYDEDMEYFRGVSNYIAVAIHSPVFPAMKKKFIGPG